MKVWSLGICAGVLVVAVVLCGCTTNVEDLYQYGIEGRKPREITVRGVAEVVVPPDFVTIETRVVTLDKDVGTAQAENDRRTRAILSLVKEVGVSAEDVTTGYLSLGPKEHWQRNGPPISEGYQVSKSITVVLRDMAKYDRLLSGMVESGVNRIRGVSFGSTQEGKNREAARKLAIKDAQEKAEYLAAEVGQKVGRPLQISEFRREDEYEYEEESMSFYSVAVDEEETELEAHVGTIAPGNLIIRVEVEVSFELLD